MRVILFRRALHGREIAALRAELMKLRMAAAAQGETSPTHADSA